MPLIEIYGYIGSALVVISMLMASVVKLRIINTIGSLISGSYALIIGSFPLALMNACLIVINIYNLRKLLITKERYDLLPCDFNDAVIDYFLDYYKDDIKTYFPDFSGVSSGMDHVYVIFCNGVPAGIFLGKYIGTDTVQIFLEYTTPAYRDCSIGRFLYEEFKKKGIVSLMMRNPSEKHTPYLTKMGYQLKNHYYRKHLK